MYKIDKRRQRASLSCVACRTRKVKCDKSQPCTSCVRHKTAKECKYDYPTHHIDRAINCEGSNKQTYLKMNFMVNKNTEITNLQGSTSSNDPNFQRRYNVEALGNKENDISQEASTTISLFSELRRISTCIEEMRSSINLLSNSVLGGNIKNQQITENQENSINMKQPLEFVFEKDNNSDIQFTYNKEGFIENLFLSQNDTVNFYDDFILQDMDPTKSNNYEPFVWTSLFDKDPGLLSIKKYSHDQKKRCEIEDLEKSEHFLDSSNIFISEKNSMESTRDKVDLESPQKEEHDKKTLLIGTIGKRQRIFSPKIIHSQEILKQLIIRTLPKKSLISKYLNNFFESVYPYMPFLDEYEFNEHIERILETSDNEDDEICGLTINCKEDFAVMGILLVVVKLSHLSSISNQQIVLEYLSNRGNGESMVSMRLDSQTQKFCPDAIVVAEQCLQQFYLLRKTSLSVLQCALFLKVYRACDPEEGDGANGGNSQIHNNILIQIAYSIGLNRDPGKLKYYPDSEKAGNIRRKVWHYLLVYDLVSSYLYGSPFTTNGIFYDTDFPSVQNNSANLFDSNFDNIITSFYRFSSDYLMIYVKPILLSALNIRDRINIKEFVTQLDSLEANTLRIFGSIEDYFKVPVNQEVQHSCEKTTQFKILVTIKCFYFTISFHMYLYYQIRGNSKLSWYYLKKLVVISLVETLPYFLPTLITGIKYFGKGADMIITPDLQIAMHRTIDILLSIMVKVKASDPRGAFTSSIKLVNNLETCMNLTLAAITSLKSRYFYSWVISKSRIYYYELIKKENLLKNTNVLTNKLILTEEIIISLNEICECALDKSKIEFQKCLEDSNIELDFDSLFVNKAASTVGIFNTRAQSRDSTSPRKQKELHRKVLDEIDSFWLSISSGIDTQYDNPYNLWGQINGEKPEVSHSENFTGQNINLDDVNKSDYLSDRNLFEDLSLYDLFQTG